MLGKVDLQEVRDLGPRSALHRPEGRGTFVELVGDLLMGDSLRVMDVGARGGLHSLFLLIPSVTEIIGFEPDEEECERLRCLTRGQGWRSAQIVPRALSGQGGDRMMYITRRPDLSSLLPPLTTSSPDWDVVQTRLIPTETFESLRVGGLLEGRWDYVKIDVQGLEYELLDRLPPDLAEPLVGVEVECRVQQHYRGQHSMAEIIDLMSARGFDLVAFDPVFEGGSKVDESEPWPPSRRRLSHGDLLFLRPIEWPAASGASGEEVRARAGHLAVVSMLHGYWTMALALAERFLPEELTAISKLLSGAEHTWSWRCRILAAAMALLIHPSRRQRFELARRVVSVQGSSGHTWRLSIPKL